MIWNVFTKLGEPDDISPVQGLLLIYVLVTFCLDYYAIEEVAIENGNNTDGYCKCL